MALLCRPPFSWALRLAGVPAEVIREARAMPAQIEAHLANAPRIAQTLGPRGWILFGLAPLDEYVEAVERIEAGHADEADQVIEDAWNDPDGIRLSWAYHRISTLYQRSKADREIGFARQRLAREAVALHKEGRYSAAIPLALTQIDGIVADITGNQPKMFFTRKRLPTHLTDDITLAGHPAGLMALSRLMTPSVNQTTIEEPTHVVRNGVMHGRTLAYGTRRLSTMALVALMATAEWAKPQADEALAESQEEIRRRYAGTRERDEDGRLYDREGFDEIQTFLRYAEGQQRRHYEETGRYASSRSDLDPSGVIFEDSDITITASDEGEAWMAWLAAPTGYVFGLAQRGDDPFTWQYADWHPPGSVDSDPGWRYEGDPGVDSHPDF
ncbi:MAG: hypothetical protein V7607_6725 [Solirubrobacteraceae bacterium]